MTRRLDEVLRPYAWGTQVPEDAALICHPVLYYALHRISAPSFPGFMAGTSRLQVPVIADQALPHGRWQLLLAQGGIPQPRLAVVREMVPGLGAP